MEAGEVVACMMVDRNEWQLELGDVVKRVEEAVLKIGDSEVGLGTLRDTGHMFRQ